METLAAHGVAYWHVFVGYVSTHMDTGRQVDALAHRSINRRRARDGAPAARLARVHTVTPDPLHGPAA
ncbi:hypothetical protein HIM_01538 [Hirsutella minnesotensis 3608]|nr:hypothetical protein HIM_01538 [Hirsutella minnesotensis 3608]